MIFWILIFDPNWPFSQCTVTDFQNSLIFRIFGVFSSGFLHRTTLMWLRIVFRMIFWILIFDPNWPFCQGYSLCTMADFHNCHISLIFGIFSSGFLHRTTLMWLKNRSLHVFLNFNFLPKLTILPRHDDRFSKSSHFSNIWCFLKRFYAQNNSNVIKESFFACFS